MNEKTPLSRRISISSVFFFYGLSYASWAARIPTIQQNLHLSETVLGGILFFMPIGSFITLPFSGWLIAKMGSRRVLMFAAFSYVIMLACIGFSNSIFQLVLSLFLFGSFGNMLNISVNTQAIGVEALYGKRILSSFHGVWSAAGLVGAGIGIFAIGRSVGTAGHLLGISIFSFAVMAISIPYLLQHDINQDKKRKVFVKPDKALIILSMIAFCSMMCQGAMFDWTGVYFKKVLHADKAYIGVGLTVFMVSMAAIRFLADWLTHHIGLKKVLLLSGIISSGGLIVSVCFPFLIPATIGFMLVGIGVSPVVPLLFSTAGKSKSLSPGVAIAAVSTLGFVGLLIGPPMIGFVAGATTLKTSFVILAGIAFMVSALSFKVKEE